MPEAIEHRADLAIHRELEIDRPDAEMEPFRFVGYDGKPIDPIGGDLTLQCFTPQGEAINGVTPSIEGGLVKFKADTTGEEWRLGEYYHAEITLSKEGNSYYRFFYFDVVVFKLPLTIEEGHFPPDLKNTTRESDFSRIVQLSRAAVMRRIRRHIRFNGHSRKRVRAALVRNPENFADAHLNLALAMAYREAIRESGDHFAFLYQEHYKRYEAEMKQALQTLDYDINENKRIEPSEAGIKPPPFFKR